MLNSDRNNIALDLVCFCLILSLGLAAVPAFGQNAANDPASASSADSPSSPSTPAKPAPIQASPNGYTIGVDDSLFISVWKEPDLSAGVTVRPDGIITLPLINDIKVTGLTTEQLQDLLTDKFKAFVNEPQVTVMVREIRSRKVFLAGRVGHAGEFPMTGNMTIMELLSQGGGPVMFAKTESIYILRKQNGKETKIPFKYKKTLAGKFNDIPLQPGDMVVVP